MIDKKGFRQNVGIIILNQQNKVLIGKRFGQRSWQFPQGGVNQNETPREALFRELFEEVGLTYEHVKLIAYTSSWLTYRLPKKFQRKNTFPVCIGQKQKWFLLRMLVDDSVLSFDHTNSPEFDAFRWVNYWHPVDEVIFFKKQVYRRALKELAYRAKLSVKG